MGAFLEGFFGGGGGKSFMYDLRYADLLEPTGTSSCSVFCEYKGEIHQLGVGQSSGASTAPHYKFADNGWESVSTIPYKFTSGDVVVLDDGIHLLGTSSTSSQGYRHYRWNGEAWTSMSTIPYDFYNGSACVRKGKIHIMGGNSGATKHYVWDKSAWTSVATLPVSYSTYGHRAVCIDDEDIHLFPSGSSDNHLIYDGTSWTKKTAPYNTTYLTPEVFENKIHLLGCWQPGQPSSTSPCNAHFMIDGEDWVQCADLPYDFRQGKTVVHNKHIRIFGGSASGTTKFHHELQVELIRKDK